MDDIINTGKETREIKRAIAVKMVLQGFKVRDIEALLNVSGPFVSKWKTIYEKNGCDGLKSGYKGSESYLTDSQREEVITFLKSRDHYTPEELRDRLESEYGIIYKSKQSYYELLYEGGISWKKSENVNPKKDENEIISQREVIKDEIKKHWEQIKKNEVAVLMQDESHLLWGDTLGYVWGRRNEKTGVPIMNKRERQTYYGALNIMTGEFHIQPYESGNGTNTVSFVKYLEEIYKGSKIILIWDKASYHRYGKMREYLKEINQGTEEKDWKIKCVPFAPNAPEQNPVEDIWRKGKNFLRRIFYKNKTFQDVKDNFYNFLKGEIFSFPKLELYIK